MAIDQDARRERIRLAAIGKKRCFNCNHFGVDPTHRGDPIGYCKVSKKAWGLGEIEYKRRCSQWESEIERLDAEDNEAAAEGAPWMI